MTYLSLVWWQSVKNLKGSEQLWEAVSLQQASGASVIWNRTITRCRLQWICASVLLLSDCIFEMNNGGARLPLVSISSECKLLESHFLKINMSAGGHTGQESSFCLWDADNETTNKSKPLSPGEEVIPTFITIQMFWWPHLTLIRQ